MVHYKFFQLKFNAGICKLHSEKAKYETAYSPPQRKMLIITSLHVGWNLRSDPSGCSRLHTPPNAVASSARSPVLEEKGFEISVQLYAIRSIYLGRAATLYFHTIFFIDPHGVTVMYSRVGSNLKGNGSSPSGTYPSEWAMGFPSLKHSISRIYDHHSWREYVPRFKWLSQTKKKRCYQHFITRESSYINLWRILVPAVLSKRIFPSRTEGYSHQPMELHSDRLLVPRFILLKLEHFMPMWQAKSSSMQRRRAKTASLGCLNLIGVLPDHGKTKPEGIYEEWYPQRIDYLSSSRSRNWSPICNTFGPRNAKPDWWVRSI